MWFYVRLLVAGMAGLAQGALAADLAELRLTGVVVGPQARVAIFFDPAHGIPTALREGEAVGPYQVQAIRPDSVLMTGPYGARIFALQGNGRPAEPVPVSSPPAAFASAQDEGKAIGRLATQHDACVRSGHLPPGGRNAGEQLRQMLDAMANLPSRTGEDAVSDAPAKQLSEAMRSGWAEAAREDAGTVATATLCGRVEALWKASATRYGFQ